MRYDLMVHDRKGKQVEVFQELPDKGNNFPTVILVPGFGMDLHEYGYFDAISDVLIRNGFQTFRFSFAGTGKSGGDFVTTTIDQQAEQLRDVVGYVMKDRFIDKKKVGILAQFFGTAVTVAALPLPQIKTFLFTSAPAYPYNSLSKWFKRQRGFNPESISEIERTDKRKTRVGPEFWKALVKHDLPKEITKIDAPVLFIHGSKDKKVKIQELEEYFEAVKSRKKVHIIEQGDHAFTGKFRPKILELIVEWFLEELAY